MIATGEVSRASVIKLGGLTGLFVAIDDTFMLELTTCIA